MTPSPSSSRLLLLRDITLHGSSPVERTHALRFLFPDTTIADWCFKHSLTYELDTVEMSWRTYTYIVFSQIKDEEL